MTCSENLSIGLMLSGCQTSSYISHAQIRQVFQSIKLMVPAGSPVVWIDCDQRITVKLYEVEYLEGRMY